MLSDRPDQLEPENDDLPLVKASELTEYDFCARAWWLGRVKKVSPAVQPGLAVGRAVHAQHGQQVQAVTHWRIIGLVLLGAGGIMLLGAACLAFV